MKERETYQRIGELYGELLGILRGGNLSLCQYRVIGRPMPETATFEWLRLYGGEIARSSAVVSIREIQDANSLESLAVVIAQRMELGKGSA